MSYFTILLVEDNPADAELIKEYLREDRIYEYHVMQAETLAAALSMLSREDIDVVLLDLSLPDSKGFDTVWRILSDYPQLVLVILTGIKDQQLALQAVRFGAQDYLEKDGLTPSLLQRSIAYAIERKKAALEKMGLFADLGNALEQLEVLQGILPICGSCKKVRDATGTWQLIETYIRNCAKEKGGQLICPTCREELALDLE